MTDYDIDLLPPGGQSIEPNFCSQCKYREDLIWHGVEVGWVCGHRDRPYEQLDEDQEACGEWERK